MVSPITESYRQLVVTKSTSADAPNAGANGFEALVLELHILPVDLWATLLGRLRIPGDVLPELPYVPPVVGTGRHREVDAPGELVQDVEAVRAERGLLIEHPPIEVQHRLPVGVDDGEKVDTV